MRPSLSFTQDAFFPWPLPGVRGRALAGCGAAPCKRRPPAGCGDAHGKARYSSSSSFFKNAFSPQVLNFSKTAWLPPAAMALMCTGPPF